MENGFSFTYSAQENQEVLRIREKYLPREESKLEELKRLDRLVQNSGITEALSVGILSCLVFGAGMCFAMKVIGNAVWLGLLLGLAGMTGMLAAYPVNRKLYNKAKLAHTPRILELTRELTGKS